VSSIFLGSAVSVFLVALKLVPRRNWLEAARVFPAFFKLLFSC
jgi:hypothetical protein